MSVREGLIIALPEKKGGDPLWMRVVDGAVVQQGAGANWLATCGLTALSEGCVVMLLPPAGLTTLHWALHPDLPVRQARAAARLSALAGSISGAESLFAATDDNDDPARPHIVAVVDRADLQHWLLWAQHHGLDPDILVPPALLLPVPEAGFARGAIGDAEILRGVDLALSGDMAMPALIGDAMVQDVPADIIISNAINALDAPPLNLRQGDFGKRVRRVVDRKVMQRMALWCGLILLASLLMALIDIGRQHFEASRLDAESLALARTVLPNVTDPVQAVVEMDARLASRGVGIYAFTAPAAGLFTAMQATPGVAITAISRDPDGMLRATLAAAKAQDINSVLVALQAAGFAITASSSQDPGGLTLADITVTS